MVHHILQYSLVTSAGGHARHFGDIGAATLHTVAANHDITISLWKQQKQIVNTHHQKSTASS
jgi:hypothetical protein